MKLAKVFALLVSILLAVSLCSIGVMAAAAKTSTGSASITFYSDTSTVPKDQTNPATPTTPAVPSAPGGSVSNSNGGSDVRDSVKTSSTASSIVSGDKTILEEKAPLVIENPEMLPVGIMNPGIPLGTLGSLPKTGGNLLLPLLLIATGAAFLIAALRSGTGEASGQSASS